MTMIIFIVVCGLGSTLGFFPNHIDVDIPKEDFTLQSITRAALLRVTANFLQDQLPINSSISLVNLNPLTESSLFSAYYGDEVSPKKFAGSILSVAAAAAKSCTSGNNAATFNNEEIANGQALLLNIRADLLEALAKPENETNFGLVRELIGSYICTQSSFYSNTNWVEISGADLYMDLGITKSIAPFIARSSEPTCENCIPASGSCSSNILSASVLISGYLTEKPRLDAGGALGKCSHGGLRDASRTVPATGGINKETSDPRFSPHHDLHRTAGQAATEAVIDLFMNIDGGLLQNMSAGTFERLLQLGTGVTLCVVMDTTGSMEPVVNAVKFQTEVLAVQRSQSVNAPEKYIYVPFGDPEVGPVHVTTNVTEFVQLLKLLSADGGDDCPEMSMRAILLGIEASSDFSDVFIFTDATAKDHALADSVIATALEKNIIPRFILTGTCNSSYAGLYDEIARQTGGTVFFSMGPNHRPTVGVISLFSGADQVSVTKQSTDSNSVIFVIPIDSTVKAFSVVVSTNSSIRLPAMHLYRPPGDGPEQNSSTKTDYLVVFDIKKVTAGNWLLRLDSATKGLKIEVVAASSLDIQLEFYEEKNNGFAFPIEGKPVAGSTATIGVTIHDANNVANFTMLVLITDEGNVISKHDLTKVQDNFLTTTTTIPRQGFRVLLTGTDSSGNTIQRLLDSYYEPLNFWLTLETSTPVRLTPGKSAVVKYTLHNAGAEETFLVSVTAGGSGLVNVPETTVGSAPRSFDFTIDDLSLPSNGSHSIVSIIARVKSSSRISATNFKTFNVYVTSNQWIDGSSINVTYASINVTYATDPSNPFGDISIVTIAAVIGGVAAILIVATIIFIGLLYNTTRWRRNLKEPEGPKVLTNTPVYDDIS